MRLPDAATKYGITYRQLDCWIRSGWIRVPGSGSGNRRTLPVTEAPVLKVMTHLVRGGFTPAAAARYARTAVNATERSVVLFPGVTLTLQRPEPTA